MRAALVVAVLLGSAAPAAARPDRELLLGTLRPPQVEVNWDYRFTESQLVPLSRRGAAGERDPLAEAEEARARIDRGEGEPADWLSVAWALHRGGQAPQAGEAFHRAFLEYRRALEGAPEDPHLRLAYGRALAGFGRALGSREALGDAADQLAQAWNLDPTLGEAASEAAGLLHLTSLLQPDDRELARRARTWILRAIDSDPRAHYALFLLVQQWMVDVVPVLQSASEETYFGALDRQTDLLLAQSRDLDDPELTLTVLHVGLGLLAVAHAVQLDGPDRPVAEWPDTRRAYVDRVLAELGETAEGLAEYPEVRARALERRWQFAVFRGREDEPRLFDAALRVSERPAALAEMRVGLLRKLGHPERLPEAAASLIALRDDVRTRLLLGISAYRGGDYAAAAEQFRRAAERDETGAAAWLGAGVALLRGGADPAEALDAFARAAQLDPADGRAEHGAAVAHALAGDLEAARAAIGRARALLPEDPGVQRAAEELGVPPPPGAGGR